MDHCLGHPVMPAGNYHYHFFAWGPEYDGCPMSCAADEVSDIMGVALDGFPIYGPMQYYSLDEDKIYIDPSNCDDCELTMINYQRDACGGLEVADGDESDGTHYRYITSNLFPYILQCWRGDMGLTQKYNVKNDNYRKINFENKCGVNSQGDDTDGGTWDGVSWVGGWTSLRPNTSANLHVVPSLRTNFTSDHLHFGPRFFFIFNLTHMF